MRQNRMFIPSLREAPAEAEAASHRLLLRAGFIRQTAAGIYSYLPLGWRVLNKLAEIVREELDSVGAQQLLMPALQPAELWQESGRDAAYGEELIRLRDRHHREFMLGPTHEEVITALARNELSSYRKLPVTLYQVQTKFRDERRPRFGLLRGREFLMKDAYSFHADWSSLDQTYKEMYSAYTTIFNRCGLNVRPVEADAGAIGGDGETHEFMALADIGEDTIVSCDRCDYAANLEKAEMRWSGSPHSEQPQPELAQQELADAPACEKFETPGVRTIQELADFTGETADRFAKTLIYQSGGKLFAVLIRGDREANEIKIRQAIGSDDLELADAAAIERATGAPVGFAGPVGLAIPLLTDREAASMSSMITGANEQDRHLRHVKPGRDFDTGRIGDFRNAEEGDGCPRCSGALRFHRGIEVGHVFKLGTKYSVKLEANFTDAAGKAQPLIMGCYGIGVSRLLSAAAEQNHDGRGLVWPDSIAPYHVHLIPVSVKDAEQLRLAEEIYAQLGAAGVEVLLDDRDERPGVKFNDADLIGIPVRIVVGRQANERLIEYVERNRPDKMVVGAEAAVAQAIKRFGRN